VFEINGNGRPNTFRKDVIAFNANGLGSSCAIEIDGKCFGAAFSPTPMTYAECAGENATSAEHETEAGSYAKSLGISKCFYTNDYWAGAVKQCNGIQNMPTMADLGKIVSLLYEGNPTAGAEDDVDNLTYNGKASQYGLPEPYFSIWSGDEYATLGYSAYYRFFNDSGTYWHIGNRWGDFLGMCIVK